MSLPDTYLELDYIASTGTQWVDSGVSASSTDIITIKGKYDAYFTSDTHAELLGCHNSGTYLRVGIINGSDSNKKFFATTGYWNEDITGGIHGRGYIVRDADLDEHTFIYDFAGNSLTIDDTTYPLGYDASKTRSAAGTSIVIFGFRQGDYYGVGAKAIFKMESCIIQQNGNVVRNYVPALRKEDLKSGLYDLINDTFLVNQNQTGTDFTYELKNYKTIVPIDAGTQIASYKTYLNDSDVYNTKYYNKGE